MAAGDLTPGRRRPDTPFGDLPAELRAGDYWRYLDRKTGEPKDCGDDHAARGNLTRGVWGFVSPIDVDAMGLLSLHTVRENEDGTATIAPNDGSSNSVRITRTPLSSWHGYLDHGVWREV